jgi:predicted nucleic acid-binding protein
VNVVADASPLIVLAKIGYLDLVPTLYKPVTISLQVKAEVVVAGAGLPGASQVAKSDWIEVRQLGDTGELAAAQAQYGLDIGELSTILLATEIGSTTVLMDESRGRRLAKERGLEVRGTIGILENLLQRGAIPDLRVAFQRIVAQGAYVSLDLLNGRLRSYGLLPLRHR